MKLSQALDFNNNQAKTMRIENVVVGSAGTGQQGRIISDGTALKYYDGSAWQTVQTGVVPDATTGAKGIIQLAGDLGGAGTTAAVPVLLAANTSITSLANVTTINSGGNVRVGTTIGVGAGAIVNVGIQVGPTIAANAAIAGIFSVPQVTSQAAASLVAVKGNMGITLVNSATTLEMAIFKALDPGTNGSGYANATAAVLTNVYGFYAPAQTIGAATGVTVTNAYGIRADMPTAGGTNWAAWFDGATRINGVITAGSGPTAITNAAGNLLASALTGTTPAGVEPAHLGDVTNSAGSLTLNLVATSNATLATLSALTSISSSSLQLPAAVGIGVASNASIGLRIVPTIASAGSAYGINMSPAMTTQAAGTYAGLVTSTSLTLVNSATTLEWSGLKVASATYINATSAVLTNVYGLQVVPQVLGGATGVTVTTAYGVYAGMPTVGGTNWAAWFDGATRINGILTMGSTPVAITNAAGNVLATALTGTLAAAQFPALTGDVTTSAGSLATSLVATTNGTLTTLSAITTLNSGGNIRVGTTIGVGVGASSGTVISVGGTVVTGAAMIGVNIAPTMTSQASSVLSGLQAGAAITLVNSATTSEVSMLRAKSPTYTNATAAVLTNLYGIYSIAQTLGGATGITVTNAYGLYVETPTAGATNWNTWLDGATRINGIITAGSGANAITTSAGLLDATKLTGAASGLSSVTTTGDVTVGGNLNITGQINETTVATLSVADYDVMVANTASTTTSTFTSPTYTSGALTDGRSPGINIMRYSASAQRQDMSVVWDESAKKWVASTLKSGAATTDAPVTRSIATIFTLASTTSNPQAVAHNLNASFPVILAFETSTGIKIEPDITITDANTVSIQHASAPTAGQYTYVILG